MVSLAVLFLILWLLRAIRKGADISYNTAINAAIVGIPSGVVFARLLHVIDKWSYYIENPGQIIGGGGLTIYGAVLGAALGIWIYSKIKKFSFGYFVDVLAPGIILAQAIGRVGCVLNGCCYGSETFIFCAVIYTNPESLAPIGVGVHPTQVYEIIYNLIVFGVLLLLRGRLRPDGSLFMVYLSLYSLWRFAIGFIRDVDPFLFGLQQAQIIGLVILAIGIIFMVRRMRWVKKEA